MALSDVCNCTQMILFYEKIINFSLWKFISNNVVYHQEIVEAVAILFFFNQDKYDDKKVFGCNLFLIFCIEYFLYFYMLERCRIVFNNEKINVNMDSKSYKINHGNGLSYLLQLIS